MAENSRNVNFDKIDAENRKNLLRTIPRCEGDAKTNTNEMPKLKRKTDEKKSENFSVRITPSIRAMLNEIARLEKASPNSVINWLIEVEAQRRGL